jgi:hypothetical protein
MKTYRIMLDISNVYPKIRHLFLKIYNSPFPTVFVNANDPDEACFIVFNDLIKIIIKQNPSIEMRLVCREIIQYSRIDKVYEL